MEPEATNRLPSPPDDLATRALPIKLVSGRIYRIHRSANECLFFGKNRTGRFDDPLEEFGVLYAAVQPEAAFAEVFLRQLSLMLLREQDLQERSISEIRCKPLRCVDLTGSGLRRVSCDNRIATEKPYGTVRLWSRAFFGHPQSPDGILFRSRHNPQFACLALFERCRVKLTLSGSESLMGAMQRSWSLSQVAKYCLAIEPLI